MDDTKWEFCRAGEVKNGRVAMLAVIGWFAPNFFRLPGDLVPGLAFKDIPVGVAAINVIPAQFWIALFFAIGGKYVFEHLFVVVWLSMVIA